VKIGGGLTYVVGSMGAGKTYYGVRKIVAATLAGQYAVTNVQLKDDWSQTVARHICRTSRKKRQLLSDRLRQLYVYEPEVLEMSRFRLPGKGEARGLLVIDEGQNDLNNRDWKQVGRSEMLQFSTQLRKLGYSGFLLSQHADNTDVALRRVCNYVVRLQNQKEQTRVMGVRITPIPLFLAIWHPTHVAIAMQAKNKPLRIERYFLGWQKNLYDTHQLYHGLAVSDVDNAVYLPELPSLKDVRARAKRRAVGKPVPVTPSTPLLQVVAAVSRSDEGGPHHPPSDLLTVDDDLFDDSGESLADEAEGSRVYLPGATRFD